MTPIERANVIGYSSDKVLPVGHNVFKHSITNCLCSPRVGKLVGTAPSVIFSILEVKQAHATTGNMTVH